MYRFYANNAQCKHIFLACCHDNGYVAELDKYRHDVTAAPKTILVKHGNTANGFYNLGFQLASFTNAFEMQPLQALRRLEQPSVFAPKIIRKVSVDSSSQSSEAPAAATWSTVARQPSRPGVASPAEMNGFNLPTETLKISKTVTGDAKTGIPVNRHGERIDRKINQPSSAETSRFDTRISDQKLCNTQHLTSSGCFAYNCKFDHSEIDAAMKNTLKYKARSIPCSNGTRCRKLECFFGHQCPWGSDQCSNMKCVFYRNSLHDVVDLEIAKFVPAVG